MAKIDERMLVNVNGGANNNKFYRVELHDDGTIIKNWGRVGATGQTQTVKGGRQAFDTLIRQKQARGYSEVDTVAHSTSSGTAQLRTAAQETLASGDPELAKLIDRLVAANRHQIGEASGGMISVSVDGQVTTPLGAISAHAIAQARTLLDQLRQSSGDRVQLTEQYLRLIPQKVPAKAGWAEDWIVKHTTAEKQSELLDALEQTVRFANSQQHADGSDQLNTDLFRYRIAPVDVRSDEFRKLVQHYDDTKQSGVHAWASKRPVRAYRLTDVRRGAEVEATQKRVRNIRQLWHGTGVANVLSILAQGLYVPPRRGSTVHITARMFGDGVYLSKSASKSLGYSVGYWNGQRGGASFMLLTETAMGSEYRPSGTTWNPGIAQLARTEKNKFGNHYDSINVAAGRAGVRNHEAIVWNPDQVKLTYLIEFE